MKEEDLYKELNKELDLIARNFMKLMDKLSKVEVKEEQMIKKNDSLFDELSLEEKTFATVSLNQDYVKAIDDLYEIIKRQEESYEIIKEITGDKIDVVKCMNAVLETTAKVSNSKYILTIQKRK